jgi:signal transduction histidine kinase
LLTSETKQDNDNDVQYEDRMETLVDISAACEVAVNILDDLLFYDKLDSGILRTNKKKTEIRNLIQTTFQSFSAQAKEREITYKLLAIKSRTLVRQRSLAKVLIPEMTPFNPDMVNDINASPLESTDLMYADVRKFKQVLNNLLSNALKYTPRGIYVYIYMYLYMYMYMNMLVHLYLYICVYFYEYIYMYVYTYIYFIIEYFEIYS